MLSNANLCLVFVPSMYQFLRRFFLKHNCWKEKTNYRVEIFCVHVMWNIFVVKVKLFRRDVNRILIGDMKKQLYIYKAPMYHPKVNK
jgi:hypothetical protein